MGEDKSQRSGRERSDEMVRANAKRSASRKATVGMVAALVLVGWSAGARAQQLQNVAASDLPGGYVVVPKIVVHTTGGDPAVAPGGLATDTLLQMSNTNEAAAITVDCWWVDANSHCGSCDPLLLDCIICDSNAQCPPGLNCVPGWSISDFQVILTPGQPIGFTASSGLSDIPCESFPGDPPTCQTAGGGLIKGVQEDPFRGELKCVQVDANDIPVARSDLKIEATVIRTTVPEIPPGGPGVTTAATYNGIGFAATSVGPGGLDDPLCLGTIPEGSPDTCAASYVPCPGILVLDHFFEGANPEFGGIVNTDLTLVPCSEDLGDPDVSGNFEVVAQMLIYNEFELRLSVNTRVECYRSTTLSAIDKPFSPTFSAFSVGVQGTLTGQTRIRGVKGADGRLGYGLLGVACENYREFGGGPILATTAFNLHHSGFRAPGDAVYRTIFPPP